MTRAIEAAIEGYWVLVCPQILGFSRLINLSARYLEPGFSTPVLGALYFLNVPRLMLKNCLVIRSCVWRKILLKFVTHHVTDHRVRYK